MNTMIHIIFRIGSFSYKTVFSCLVELPGNKKPHVLNKKWSLFQEKVMNIILYSYNSIERYFILMQIELFLFPMPYHFYYCHFKLTIEYKYPSNIITHGNHYYKN